MITDATVEWTPTFALGRQAAGAWLGAYRLPGEDWVIEAVHCDFNGLWTRATFPVAQVVAPPLYVMPLRALEALLPDIS